MANLLLPDALTTLANLKATLNVTTTTNDDYLQQLINRATQYIEGRTNRRTPDGKYGLKARQYNGTSVPDATKFHPTTKIPDEDYVYFSGRTRDLGGDTLKDDLGQGNMIPTYQAYGMFHLPAYPVQDNSVLTFVLAVLTKRDSTGETWDATQLVEWRDYVVDRNRGILRMTGGPFSSDYRNYRVTMAAGYQYGVNDPYVPADLEDCCIQVCKDMLYDSFGVTGESLGDWRRTFNPEKQNQIIEDAISRYTLYKL